MKPKKIWSTTVEDIMDDPMMAQLAEDNGMTAFELEDSLAMMLDILNGTEDPYEMYQFMNDDLSMWAAISRVFQYFDVKNIFRDIEDWAMSY